MAITVKALLRPLGDSSGIDEASALQNLLNDAAANGRLVQLVDAKDTKYRLAIFQSDD